MRLVAYWDRDVQPGLHLSALHRREDESLSCAKIQPRRAGRRILRWNRFAGEHNRHVNLVGWHFSESISEKPLEARCW